MIAFRNGIFCIQHRIDGSVDLLAILDVHTAVFVDIHTQIAFAAFPDIFHIPELAAVGFHNGKCQLGNKIGYFHLWISFLSAMLKLTRKRGARASLFLYLPIYGSIIPPRKRICKRVFRDFLFFPGVILSFSTQKIPLPRKKEGKSAPGKSPY
jgi:hypothetical protein